MIPELGEQTRAGDLPHRPEAGDRRARVSVIIAAFQSQRTIGESLRCLFAQSLPPDEIVVCDSSPDEATARAIEAHPTVRLIRSRERLLPQEARARGIDASRCELLLFTDPDVYTEPQWLERLVELHRKRRPAVVSGALACWDQDWLNRAIHVCKFARWLPGGRVRPVDNVPTACLLILRNLYEELGGFDDAMFGDAQLSRRAAEHGEVLLEPTAIGHHDHGMTLRDFVRERWVRGLRAGMASDATPARLATRLLVTVLPLRLAHSLYLSLLDCARGPGVGAWLRALPILALGQIVTLAGEARGMIGRLLRRAGSLRRASRPQTRVPRERAGGS